MVWRIYFLILSKYFRNFICISPWEKAWLFMNKLEFNEPGNWLSGFGEEDENDKIYRQTDDRRSKKLLELSAEKFYYNCMYKFNLVFQLKLKCVGLLWNHFYSCGQ